jgi:GNAT superfamily N-acetyltransferase
MNAKVKVVIRRVRAEEFAAEADAAATVYLASRHALLPGLHNPHTEEQTRAWMRDTVFTQHSVRMAEVDDEIVGFASRDGSWLMNLYVKPGWTGHGIGSQLLAAMLANAAGATPVLRVCTFSRYERVGRFFERNGFKAVASGDGAGNEEHEPDIRYERSTRT